MRKLITALIVLLLFSGILVVTGEQEIINLSTLNKKPTNVAMVNLNIKAGAEVNTASNLEPINLSILNKMPVVTNANIVSITGPAPTIITPMFAIKNTNISVSSESGTVYTPAIAIRNSNIIAGVPNTIFTLPIAIGPNNQTE